VSQAFGVTYVRWFLWGSRNPIPRERAPKIRLKSTVAISKDICRGAEAPAEPPRQAKQKDATRHFSLPLRL